MHHGIHNGLGGRFGWQRAGTIEVVAPKTHVSQVFGVREFGARGNDLENDYEAIRAAIAAAEKAGGGVVFFPPGL